MPTAEAEITILNRNGLHARPAMQLVDTASQFSSEVRVHKGGQAVDAKSIMQVLMLAATHGAVLKVSADGDDADAAVAAVRALVATRFGEDG
ncbi:MAG: HPr family phosphocarrier protein [Planctomycetota bacterium]